MSNEGEIYPEQARLDVYLYMSGRTEVMGTFMYRLLHAWSHADSQNQLRLAAGFPEIATAIWQYNNMFDEYFREMDAHFNGREVNSES